MKRIYRLAGAMIVIAGVCFNVNAQTISYGDAAGKQGSDGTYIGYYSGATTIGADNTFIGSMSGPSNVGGNRNTTLGSRSAYDNKNGSDNTFLGYFSGKGNSNGSWNTFVGSQTGSSNREGVRNTFLGFEAGNKNYWGSNNLFAGHRSGYFNESGNYNVFMGNSAGEYNSSGNYNVFLGYNSGGTNTSGQYNTYIGYQASGGDKLNFATAIGAAAKVTKEHSIVLGTVWDNVGIGTSAPAYQLQVSTYMAAKAGTSTWIVASDKRLKKDISDYKEGLDLLKQIKPVWFNYNGQAGMPTDKKFVGIIAQDMQKIAHHMVGTFVYQDSLGNKTEYLDYDANALTYMLVNSVKEQQQIIEQKEEKIQKLGTQITDLSKRLEQLERIVAAGTTKPLTTNPASRQEVPNENGVILEQNTPNGFSSSTSIHYFIPETIKEAVMHVYSTNGVKLFSETIDTRGQGVLHLSANDFSNGVFIYDLITDGKSSGARKMVVSK
jgi:hypothetical protein